MLNDQLDFLIQKYTLQGQSILVHCRGGVGRAGLVACCWMLKMGLCGWTQEVQLHGHVNMATNGVDLPQPPVTVKKTPADAFFQCINRPTLSPPAAPAPISSDHSDPSHPATTDENSRPRSPTGTPILSTTPPAGAAPAPEMPIQWSTVDLIERVVRVVRWRRSVKAIETYEQVRFLVEFVEFLRGGCVPTPEVEVQVGVGVAVDVDVEINVDVDVEVKAVDPNPNPDHDVVVVNGYANLVPVLDESKENGVIVDEGIHLVMKERGDQDVQET